MRILDTLDTHQGCEIACNAVGGSLACLQSMADNDVANNVQTSGGTNADITHHIWVGEYQYPFEPEMQFKLECTPNCFANMFGIAPYNGQPNWGKCSNGQTTSFTPNVLGFMQPNNFNGGEDCMARSIAGTVDDTCNNRRQCLCEYGSNTSATYASVHGPALMERAEQSSSKLYGNLWTTLIVCVVLGSLPALAVVIVIEFYLIRWRQRVAPATPAEASLQRTIKLALRRRMRQAGLSLWIGGVLFALSLPSQPYFAIGAWPSYGCCEWPMGMPIQWKMLQEPGVILIMMTILPSETVAVRVAAIAWPCYVCINWYIMEHNPPSWNFGARPPVVKHILFAGRTVALVGCLASAVFWPRIALPSRIALEWLWVCIRIEIFVAGMEFMYDSLPMLDTPYRDQLGWPMVIPGIIRMAIAVLIAAPVRRWIIGAFGGLGNRAANASAAAVVSTLVSGDAVKAIRDAHGRLHTIRISSLVEADMANNQDSGLFQKTEKTATGECDAFLSHSWRDDPASKWQRMLEFKREFEETNGGKEPRCWLDKACIDQAGDINASLKALPIFLLASKYFVVFAGKTYTKRMWCVLEIFTFVRSGGTVDSILLKPLDVGEAREAITTFDIAQADCYVRGDKQRIRAIVESCYGSFSPFNATCRAILQAKLGLKATAKSPKKYQVAPMEAGTE